MARVIYGIMGNTRGHVSRSYSLMSRLPQHHFLVVGGGTVSELRDEGYEVLEVPVLRTIHRRHRISILRTLKQILRCYFALPWQLWRIHCAVRRHRPVMAVTDREFFLPIYCRLTRLPCLSITHAQVLNACDIPVPPHLKRARRWAALSDRWVFGWVKEHWIISFFHPPLLPGRTDRLMHPVLRPHIGSVQPTCGSHILVYLTAPDCPGLLRALTQLNTPVIVYGAARQGQEGRVTYAPYDRQQILRDLAACRYAVVNGGHNLLCEAFALGKPVFCFPLRGLFEQAINARFVRSLGYGDFCENPEPTPEIFKQFESNLPKFQQAISAGFIDGSDQVAAALHERIQTAALHRVPSAKSDSA